MKASTKSTLTQERELIIWFSLLIYSICIGLNTGSFRYLAGGPHSVTVFPSKSGSSSEISSLTMSDPLWNSDVGRGRDKLAASNV